MGYQFTINFVLCFISISDIYVYLKDFLLGKRKKHLQCSRLQITLERIYLLPIKKQKENLSKSELPGGIKN